MLNKVKVITIGKCNRLLRNFVKYEHINQLLSKFKVTLISATQYHDFTAADGRKEARKRSVDIQYEML